MKGDVKGEKLLQAFKAHGYTSLTRLSLRVFQAQHSSWGLVTIKYAKELKHRHFLKQEAEFLHSNTGSCTSSGTNDIWPAYCDYFSCHQTDCLVLSHLSGNTLLEIQNRSNINADMPSQWLSTLESAINRIHTLGFVHGDIKPSNIVLNPQGQAQLIDFGSVTKMGTERTALRFESYTLRYAMLDSVTSRLDDWFALAVMLEEQLDETDLPSRYQVLLKQHR
ncbi:Hypothetical protein VCR15J2_60118 [Vibrio coralliirubri]|uniref:protein kinase domain-containing protein n=1 Tax=Vibrio coralliirubri TaxID=1516159 RepID=UPI00062EFF74|nr:AarF/UbiB family protein [Vibrio coralliirubri]CDT77390.1 Hypothetical protein VCR15J2_60118 [Vibrio coralliirubri]